MYSGLVAWASRLANTMAPQTTPSLVPSSLSWYIIAHAVGFVLFFLLFYLCLYVDSGLMTPLLLYGITFVSGRGVFGVIMDCGVIRKSA